MLSPTTKPRPTSTLTRHGAALGIVRCYACDEDATGTRDRSFDAEGATVPACVRHADHLPEAA